LSLAKPILQSRNLTGWVNHKTNNKKELGIISNRKALVPGTHTIAYNSEIEEISFTHQAHTRKGFAKGALAVANWIIKTKPIGMLGMDNFLSS
jgi:4-hydroxy-tetrahydrodipicolinate reductase